METIAQIPGIGGILVYVLPFLFILTVVVFVHEFGHFIVARWCGVRVEVFSIGFGREIFGWNDKHGTRWKVSWLPLGGYVKFFGDSSEASTPDRDQMATMSANDRAVSFHHKTLGQRAAIVAAGPIANFILSTLIFAGIFTAAGTYIIQPVVGEAVSGSPAEEAGFRAGDLILAVDGAAVRSFSDVRRRIITTCGENVNFTVSRDGAAREIIVSPRVEQVTGPDGNVRPVRRVGIRPADQAVDERALVRTGPLEGVWLGVRETQFIITSSLTYLGCAISGQGSSADVGGPIRIAKISGDVAQVSLLGLINLMAIISASIGLINLFPVPMLDGGHLMFYAYEAVRGKPLEERIQEVGFKIGLVLVLSLMVFATWNDIVQLIG